MILLEKLTVTKLFKKFHDFLNRTFHWSAFKSSPFSIKHRKYKNVCTVEIAVISCSLIFSIICNRFISEFQLAPPPSVLHWLYGLCRTLASFRIYSSHYYPQPFFSSLQHVFCRSFSTSSNRLFLGFPADRLAFGIFLNTFAAVLCSGILSPHPNSNTVVFLFYT